MNPSTASEQQVVDMQTFSRIRRTFDEGATNNYNRY
jgi:hypothetical protein